MKAISLWQPWASAIALGAKRIETRSWGTAYRGPLAIHAAKRCIKAELADLDCYHFWKGALNRRQFPPSELWAMLPFGAIVAVCRLVQCRPVHKLTESDLHEIRYRKWDADHCYGWTECELGNYGPGRFAWVLGDVTPLPGPVPWRGSQGFFEVDDACGLYLPSVPSVPSVANNQKL